MDPLISVIVPYWNAEKWIQRCVYSLKRQRGSFEFIFVNDHSQDNGERIAKTSTVFDDLFLFTSVPEGWKGVSAARNIGIAYSRGMWITFLDADDEMEPEAYSKFLTMIHQDRNALIHQANHFRYYAEKDKLALKYANPAGHYNIRNLPRQWCMVWNKLYHWTVVRDPDCLVRFDESVCYGEDELFNLECLARLQRMGREPYIHCSEEITLKRNFDNKASLAHLNSKDEKSLFIQAGKLMEFAETHHDPEIRRAVCGILSEHWGSKTYINTMCRE